MTIDITNLEHREALRVASTCMLLDKARTRDEWIAHCSDEPLALAFEALSDPAKAAELIRRLVERAGVTCIVTSVSSLWEHQGHDISVASTERGRIHVANKSAGDWQAMDVDDVPPLILRLLSIVPGAGADAVLVALRGEG